MDSVDAIQQLERECCGDQKFKDILVPLFTYHMIVYGEYCTRQHIFEKIEQCRQCKAVSGMGKFAEKACHN